MICWSSPFWQGKKGAELACKELGKVASFTHEPIKLNDFKGKEGEVDVVYMTGQAEKRLAMLGLGEEKKGSVEGLRRAFVSIVKLCQKLHLKDINILLPVSSTLSEEEVVGESRKGFSCSTTLLISSEAAL